MHYLHVTAGCLPSQMSAQSLSYINTFQDMGHYNQHLTQGTTTLGTREHACNSGEWGRKVKCCRPACAVYSEPQIICNAKTDSDKKGKKDRLFNFRTSHIKVNSHNFLPRKQVPFPATCLCIFTLQEKRF